MTIKQKLKEIEKFLKNQGFKICIDTSINEDNLQEYELEKIKGNYGGEAKIDFSKGYLPYCCGILEIGDLEINEYYKDEKSSNKNIYKCISTICIFRSIRFTHTMY
jgi:hypothetical protein